MRLEGKNGLVTAAGSGMGRAGAIRFAKEGASVGVVDIDEDSVNAVVSWQVCPFTLALWERLGSTNSLK